MFIFRWFSYLSLDEMRREREFYKSRNLPNPKDQPQNIEDDAFDRLNETHVESDYHRQDEQVNVCLECMSNNLSALKRRFLRCSSQATITHLKKFVAKKVLNGIERYKEVNTTNILSVCCSKFMHFLKFLNHNFTKNAFKLLGRYIVQRWTFGQGPHTKGKTEGIYEALVPQLIYLKHIFHIWNISLAVCVHYALAIPWSTAQAAISTTDWIVKPSNQLHYQHTFFQ